MLTNFFLTIFGGIVSFFDTLLPHVVVPDWFTSDAAGSITTTLGSYLASVKGILPVVAMLNVLHGLLLFLPLALGYLVFNWLWNHSPTIMGTSL